MEILRKLLTGGLTAMTIAGVASRSDLAAASSCESLSALVLPDARITMAQTVPAGGFARAATGAGAAGQSVTTSVAFCRVAVTLRPSADSDIKLEVWLPVAGWNGKFQAVGNGGWGGVLSYPAMNDALNGGYATSSTDTGHASVSGVAAGAAGFALGHPERLIDYAYRSVHLMAITGKAIVEAYFGEPPQRSYFNGCSTGGRQALMEAQRYADDFDGIIAGAAANPKTHLDAWRIAIAQAMFKDASTVIPRAKFPMIHQAVLGACDALDGVRDGLVSDPTRCHFDPKTITCNGDNAPSCLTRAQAATAAILMSPIHDRNTGTEVFPGFAAGTELGWAEMLGGPAPLEMAIDQYKYIIFKDANWDWRSFNLERDVAVADRVAAGTLSAVSPDLTRFATHGGKLLMYHGWSDQAIAPRASVNYYQRALAATRSGAGDATWVRLFMIPGMGHCRGGDGPNTFDMVSALDQWVESGRAPERILATHQSGGKIDRTRPLCPYPQTAVYAGIGSTDDAASFVCRSPQ
jgi:feruloyl esterase